jgi:hypothetical protein
VKSKIALVGVLAVLVAGALGVGSAKASSCWYSPRGCVYVHSYYKPSTGSFVHSYYRNYPGYGYGYPSYSYGW